MFRTKYIRALILAAAAVAAACTADPVDPVTPEPDYDAEPASLTIDFSIADLGIDVETRAGSDTGESPDPGTGSDPTFALSPALPEGVVKYLNPDKIWTAPESEAEKDYYNEARSINGSVMTCLTVILIHRHSNRIVGIRRIPDTDCPNTPEGSYSDNSNLNNKILVKKEDGSFALGELLYDKSGNIRAMVGTHARVTFDYEDPYHVVTNAMVGSDDNKKKYIGESAERLVRGEYTILVVANYDHNVTTSVTHTGDPTLNVDKTLKDIAKLFHEPQHMAEGIPDFNPNYSFLYNIRFLMNRTLDKRADGQYDVVKITGTDGQQIKPYIRPAVHQTLTAAKEFYLGASDNHVDMELLRISSRTRVEVKNYIPNGLGEYSGDQLKLQVNSLSFSDNYTQSTNYLFRRDKNDRDYSELATTTDRYTNIYYTDHDGKGAPMVGYTGILHPGSDPTYGAIVPFVAEGNYVMPNKKKCIFDALMYESNVDYKDELTDPDSFSYTIDVSYPGITNYHTPDKNKIDTVLWKANGKPMVPDPDIASFDYAMGATKEYIEIPQGSTSFDPVYEKIQEIESGLAADNGSCCFLIQGVATNKFLYEQEDGTLYADTPQRDINLDTDGIDLKSFLWRLDGLKKEADGNYYCYLKNLRSGKHMPTIPQCETPTDQNHTKSTDDTESQKYKLGVRDQNVTFSNHFDQLCLHGKPDDPNKQYYDSYLSIWANGTYLSGWHEADAGCQYRLYPIKMIPQMLYEGTPRMRKTVKLTTFSDETAFVEEVREIQRNDFVRILVEVSYNPEKCEFQFKAVPWVKKSGSVSFH